ncbi:allantoinase [Paenibacillus caui]|uniref:allantoinase n=1 Tax=Paenibacillus caui TaxID=2873927 RepID=UPI001CAA33B8|nr:allantoinase [Paenibacillus caui]
MSDRYDLIIHGGLVVLPDEVRKMDIGIQNGKIAALADHIESHLAADTVNAEGRLVMAGMIDAHVHFNEPNLGHWEGFETGTAALAAGGCTAFADMPLNGNPPTVTLPALEIKERLAAEGSAVDYAFWGGLMPGFLDQIEGLAAAGVIGFKAFMSNPGGEGEGRFREVDRKTLHEGMKRIAAAQGVLALHAESEEMTSKLAEAARAAGKTDARAFVESRPVEAEVEAVSEALELAEQTGCRLHFVHISSPEAVDVIDAAKRRGMDVTLETCPHYLVLTASDMEELGPVAKCAPPLRDEARQAELWKRLEAGKIDFITSDHSPCPESMKDMANGTFFDAWGGIAGAQNSLELMLDEGWHKRGIPLPAISRLLSLHPAKRFGFYPRKGEIAEGFDADLVLIDPNRNYTLSREDLLHRHPHSPYIGRTFSCKVTEVYCRGRAVYREGQGIVSKAEGKWIAPAQASGGNAERGPLA